MDHGHVYDQLIQKAKERKHVEGYVERHHIVPRCLGGSDNPDNIVVLTAREHFIAHALLCYMYPHIDKLYFAFGLMAYSRKQQRKVNSKGYAHLKQQLAHALSRLLKGKICPEVTRRAVSKANRNRIYTTEILENMARAKRGKKLSESHIQKLKERVFSETHRTNISAKLKGRSFSESHRKNLRESLSKREITAEWKENLSKAGKGRTSPMKGKVLSKEHKEKISLAGRGQTRSEETKRRLSNSIKAYWVERKQRC